MVFEEIEEDEEAVGGKEADGELKEHEEEEKGGILLCLRHPPKMDAVVWNLHGVSNHPKESSIPRGIR